MGVVEFDPAAPAHADGSGAIALPATLAAAVPKRRAEWIAGRRAAAIALRDLDPALDGAAVPIGAGREPLWPAGVRGSITHAAGVAAAAVALATDARGVGLDIEGLLAPAAARAVVERVVTATERQRLSAAVDPSNPIDGDELFALTLAFSAKETLFKAVYHEVGRVFEFSDAELVDVGRTDWRLRLRTALTPALPAGLEFSGRYARFDELVITALAVPLATSPPVDASAGDRR